MIADFLESLLAANLAASAAIVAVMALRPLVRPRFGARAAYALWAAPLLAGIAAAVPHSQSAVGAAAPFVASAQAAVRALPAPAAHPDLAPLLVAGVWLGGSIAMAVWLALQQARFSRAARNGLAGPAVIGVLRPRIVTPADFEARFAANERALILAHEGAHLAVGDAGVNALACAVQCAGWFNPLFHLAVRLMRIDQEFACDAAVIDRFPQARKTYAELLLKTQLAAQAPPLGCQWPARAAHPLKERIAMLKSTLPARPERLAGLMLAALLGLGAGSLAWSASAQSAKLITTPAWITQPVWIKKPTAADFQRVYPAGGAANHSVIKATLSCGIAADGRLRDCDGFNWDSKSDHWGPKDPASIKAAMLEMSKLFQMAPRSRDGVATAGGMVQIPMMWLPPGEKP